MYAIYIYMVTFTINIPQMLAYIPYMDPMGDRLIIFTIIPGGPHGTHPKLCQTASASVRWLRAEEALGATALPVFPPEGPMAADVRQV
jgi:hypothetical protein